MAGAAWLFPPPDWAHCSAYTPLLICGFIIAAAGKGWSQFSWLSGDNPITQRAIGN